MESDEVQVIEECRCAFPPDLMLVRSVLAQLGAFLRVRGLQREDWDKIELATAEALNNAVEHGCTADSTVNVVWRWAGDRFEAAISSPCSYKPSTDPFDLLAEGGRGEFLMTSLMDEVRHEDKDGLHTVFLAKRVGLPPWKLVDAAESESLVQEITSELANAYENLAALFRLAETLATSETFSVFVSQVEDRLLSLLPLDSTRLLLKSSASSARPGSKEYEAQERGLNVSIENRDALPPSDPLHAPHGFAFVCPVVYQERILGSFTVLKDSNAPFLTAGQMNLVRLVADYIAIAKTNSEAQLAKQEEERRTRELEIATGIQQSLLPRSFPATEHLRIFGRCVSARAVGGDFFDVLQGKDGDYLLCIADVMGKGVPAALLGSMLRTALHILFERENDVGALLTALNNSITPELVANDMFITAQLVRFNPGTGQLSVANAGHGPVLRHIRNSSVLDSLDADGVPLGILEGYNYETRHYTWAAGHRLCLVTDGLYEATNPNGEMLGIEGIKSLLMQHSTGLPEADCSAILAAITRLDNGSIPADDRTIVIAERLL